MCKYDDHFCSEINVQTSKAFTRMCVLSELMWLFACLRALSDFACMRAVSEFMNACEFCKLDWYKLICLFLVDGSRGIALSCDLIKWTTETRFLFSKSKEVSGRSSESYGLHSLLFIAYFRFHYVIMFLFSCFSLPPLLSGCSHVRPSKHLPRSQPSSLYPDLRPSHPFTPLFPFPLVPSFPRPSFPLLSLLSPSSLQFPCLSLFFLLS